MTYRRNLGQKILAVVFLTIGSGMIYAVYYFGLMTFDATREMLTTDWSRTDVSQTKQDAETGLWFLYLMLFTSGTLVAVNIYLVDLRTQVFTTDDQQLHVRSFFRKRTFTWDEVSGIRPRPNRKGDHLLTLHSSREAILDLTGVLRAGKLLSEIKQHTDDANEELGKE